jgi:hypothetical protein
MGGRIREWVDDLELLEHRSGPAMGDDHRQSIGMLRADVDEVNVHVIDRCHELRQGVELGLGLPPVVIHPPVPHERLQLCQLHALRLIGDRLAVGPARGGDASAEIDELLVRNGDVKGPNRVAVTRRSKLLG